MPLKDGVYTITTLMDDLPVGVEPVDFPGPRRVMALSRNDQGTSWARWKITKKAEKVYELSVDDAVAVRAGQNVLAVPGGSQGVDKEWIVEEQEVHGKDIYTQVHSCCFMSGHQANIHLSSITSRRERWEGWFIGGAEPLTQVRVQPLITVPTYPPRYIPSEIFKIVSLAD